MSRLRSEIVLLPLFLLFPTMGCDEPTKVGEPAKDGKHDAGVPTAPTGPSEREREAWTLEAKTQSVKLYDAAASYFASEHADRGATAFIGAGGSGPTMAPHRCPPGNGGEIDSHITPPLNIDCNSGPGGLCVPTAEPTKPGEYPLSLWTSSDVWNAMNFMQEVGHRFHYRFKARNDLTGYGACQFTVQAYADLDDDGIWSTYERVGSADQNGVQGSELQINNVLE